MLAESSDNKLISRRVGRMYVSALEVAYGSLAGAIHSEMLYIVPNDLSEDEERSFDCSNTNWSWHKDNILRQSVIAEAFASNGRS